MKLQPINVVKYLLYRCSFYGDLITNLKMQKLLYYVYVWHLMKIGKPCFEEKFEAWPNGPVLPIIYQELKKFGGSPINPSFSGINSQETLNGLLKELGDSVSLIDEVYTKYGSFTPFELVDLTHNEYAWQSARRGYEDGEPSNEELSDDEILRQYGEEKV